jgi:hypothetical protein
VRKKHPGTTDTSLTQNRRHVHTLLTFKDVSDDIANDASDEDEDDS